MEQMTRELEALRREVRGVEVHDVESGVSRVERGEAEPPAEKVRREQDARVRVCGMLQARLVAVKKEAVKAEERRESTVTALSLHRGERVKLGHCVSAWKREIDTRALWPREVHVSGMYVQSARQRVGRAACLFRSLIELLSSASLLSLSCIAAAMVR